MPLEPFFLLIALLPLIAYLLLLSLIRLSGRVLVTTGGRDIAALGFAVSGLIAIGPGELFFPKAAAGTFGPWVWIALATFYALIVTLIALTTRPRLVVYGRTPEQMLDPLLAAAREMDPDASCDQQVMQIFLPRLKVHLRAAGNKAVDSSTIESFEPIVNHAFWEALLGHLRQKASLTPRPTPTRGATMLLIALGMATYVAVRAIGERQQVVEGFRQWLWR
ncbi:hypothetical protein [Roseiconus lacunae]|uniref:Uncharacterized protein n=1 Tax=Roseiconus lacunae TaxID=2605694 RepID=A0ABT7PEI1_9BACT|nr:hypothetical protein [Roseiconus lacunae]MCD0462897.1 hypothetical protein [Roseiconus lacunae]MDM4014897.1 hypothetical protein [Roseiconus lacunae]WRQ50478.1 hypothetical protein U8335_26450 [Stieleria sp. HD01]